MSILEFVTQDQLDNLEDDPHLAFMGLVNIAQRGLSAQIGRLNDDWREIEDLRHSFVNAVVASAKQYEIEPFASMDIPRVDDQLNYKQFKSDLDHYITQLVLENSTKRRRDTVEVLPKSKDRIRSYIHGLRDCLEKANMTDRKRSVLLKRLNELEAELEKRRLNMILVAKLAFEIIAIPGGTWASGEVAVKLISNISHTVSEAHEAQQTSKAISPAKPVPALSAPRKAQGTPLSATQRGGFADDLDDDVPF